LCDLPLRLLDSVTEGLFRLKALLMNQALGVLDAIELRAHPVRGVSQSGDSGAAEPGDASKRGAYNGVAKLLDCHYYQRQHDDGGDQGP
jgi:hypothetical protein